MIRLCFLFLACAATVAGAAPEDDDDEVKKDRSPAVCFALMGQGREVTALEHLARADPQVAAAAAVQVVTTSTEPKALTGAGIYLGLPKVRKLAGPQVGASVRKRWEEVGAQRRASIKARDAAKQRADAGARTQSPEQLVPLRQELTQAEAALRATTELWSALTVALGATGNTRDLIELSWLARRGSPVEVRGSARGLCASHDPFGGYHQLLRVVGEVLTKIEDQREEREEEAQERAREAKERGEAKPAKLAPSGPELRAREILTVFRDHLSRSARAGELIRAIGNQPRAAAVLETLLAVRPRKLREAVGQLARDYCQGDDPAARAVAMRLLARTRDEEAVPLLVGGLQDNNAAVRLAAAESFARLGRKRARGSLSKLVPLLSESSGEVRKAAHRALVVLSGKRIALSKVAWLRYFDALKKAGQ